MNTDLALIAALRDQVAMTPDPITHFGSDRARELLHLNGLSQEDIARILGSSVHSVSAWMRGVSTPGPQYAAAYARLLSLLARRAALLDGTLRRRIDSLLTAVGKVAA